LSGFDKVLKFMGVVVVAAVVDALANLCLPLPLHGPCNDGDNNGDGASSGGVAASARLRLVAQPSQLPGQQLWQPGLRLQTGRS
jgi:hypothetical protein